MAVSLKGTSFVLVKCKGCPAAYIVLRILWEAPSPLAGAMVVSLKGKLTIYDNDNNDNAFQLMYVNRQMASRCLLDHLASMSKKKLQA